MKTISVRQPFASLLMSGVKKYETRSWPCPKALQGQRIALHASKGYDLADEEMAMNLMGYPPAAAVISQHMPLGAVLGIVVVTACYRTHEVTPHLTPMERALGDFRPGRAAWAIRVVDVFKIPVPAKGQLGFWEWNGT